MKILLRTFSILMLVSLTLGSLIMVGVNLDWADKVEAMQSNFLSRLIVETARPDIPEAGVFNRSAFVWMAMVPVAILGIVAVFSRRHRFGWGTGVAVIGAMILAILLQPSLPNIDGNDPRVTGLGITFFGTIGALVLIGLHTFWKDIGKERFVPSTLK